MKVLTVTCRCEERKLRRHSPALPGTARQGRCAPGASVHRTAFDAVQVGNLPFYTWITL
jgi:hypothetical protein